MKDTLDVNEIIAAELIYIENELKIKGKLDYNMPFGVPIHPNQDRS